MVHPAFIRAAANVIARLGGDVVLRGEIVEPSRKAHIAQDVEIDNGQGDVFQIAYGATLNNSDSPRKGDIIVQAGIAYELGEMVSSNGASTLFVARPVVVSIASTVMGAASGESAVGFTGEAI